MKIERNKLFEIAFLFSFALLSLSLFDVYSSLRLVQNNTNKINLDPVAETQVLGTTVDSINETEPGRVLGLNGCNWLPINAAGVTTQDAPPNQEWWSNPSGGYNDPIIHQNHSLGTRNVYFDSPKKFDEILIWDNECSDSGGTNCQNAFYGTGRLFLNNTQVYEFILPTMANEQWRIHQPGSEIIADRFEYTPATRNSGTIDSGGYNFCVRPAPIAINGSCSSSNNTCTSGTLQDIADNDTTRPAKYLWNCLGLNGGSTANCSYDKPQCEGFNIYDNTNISPNWISGSIPPGKPSRNLSDTITVRVAQGGSNLTKSLICWSADGMASTEYLKNASWKCSADIPPGNGSVTKTVQEFINEIPSSTVRTFAQTNGLVFVTNGYDSFGGSCSTSPGYTNSSTFYHPGSTRSADGQPISPRTENHVCGSTNSTICKRSLGINSAINGVCGSANNTYISSAPTTNLCTTGTATSVSGTGPWTWSCNGSGSGTTANCSANLSINGACGTAARTYLFSEKAYVGLYCSAGTVTPLFPAFPQPGGTTTWTCNGIGTGSISETCTAKVLSDEDESCQTSNNTILLQGVLRDFHEAHPDFERTGYNVAGLGYEPNLVTSTLDGEGKPVLNIPNPAVPRSILDQNSFAQWFRDIPGVNEQMPYSIKLQRLGASSIFNYDNSKFFPLDNQLFGNEMTKYPDRNYHFTFEAQTDFKYKGGETFKFRGDDDVWVFIDGKLVIDIGGIHGPIEKILKLDTLGLDPTQTHKLSFFFAERHTTGSNFRMETDINWVEPVCLNIDCEINPTSPSCNLCLNPGQGNINQDSTSCNNPSKPKIKMIDENSIGDKVTGLDASQDLKLDWTNTLPVQNSQCFASYNFELKKADNDTVVMTKKLVDLSEITIPESNLDFGTNYKWKVTGNAIQSENKNYSLSFSDLTAADCAQTVVPYTITKTFDIPEYSRINSGTISIPTSNAISSISINGDIYNAPISSQDILNSIKEGTNTVVITISNPTSCGT